MSRHPAGSRPTAPRTVPAPLADRYPVAVALALIGLCPFIVLSTGSVLLQKTLMTELHASAAALQLGQALGNAGYAFGAVLAAAAISRFRLRSLFALCEGVFVAGCLMAAFSSSVQAYLAARSLQGLATGLLLVIALPPLLTRFEAGRLPLSAAITNVGLFGAATAGPLVAAGVAATAAPVALELAFAAVGLIGIVLGLIGINPELGRINPDQRVVQLVVLLALAAAVLPFVASALLPQVPFTSAPFLGLTVGGVAALLLLIWRQFRTPEPLMPVRLLSTTLPVTGTVCAMVGGAAFVALDELLATTLLDVRHESALHAGLSFWPQVAGIAAAAAAFAGIFRTRLVPLFALSGLVALAAAGLVLTLYSPVPASSPTDAVAAALLGLGAGASVSPGLFLVGLGAPSSQIGPAFALVELLRSEAAFIAAPVLLDVATGGVAPPGALSHGLSTTGFTIVAMLGAAVVVLVALYLAGGTPLRPPDLEAWLGEGEQALCSPALLAPLRESA